MPETLDPERHVKPFVYETLTRRALHFSICEIQSSMDVRDPYSLDLEYTRTMMAFLLAAYDEEEVKGEKRVVLRLHHRIAPYKVAVLPLSKKPELTGPCLEMLATLQGSFMCDYDETQSIGKRYARQDEIGTPYCVTFDFDSIEDRSVTVRDRDTMEQERIPIEGLVRYLQDKFI